jgi:hypothetical protein
MNKAVLIISMVFLSLILVTSVYGVLTSSKTVASSGKIASINVGVYTNSACTQTATSIDWGNLAAGASTTITLYIKNTGNSKETLSIATSGGAPSTASQYLTITWNQNKVALNANQVVKATLTLTVSSNIDGGITAFSSNIIITGTM